MAEPRREGSEGPVFAVGSLLAARLSTLPGIGPTRERQLAGEGVQRVGDLLQHLPLRYEDRRRVGTLAQALDSLSEETPRLAVTLRGRLSGLRRVAVRRRRFSVVQGRVQDGSAEVRAVWFNRPYLLQQVDEQREYLLHGELRRGPRGVQLMNASIEEASRALAAGRIVPVYGSLGPFGPAALRRMMAKVLEGCDPTQEIAEPLPRELLERHALPPLGQALERLHRPPAEADVERLNGRETPEHHRLVYGELLEMQLRLARRRAAIRRRNKRHRYVVDDGVRQVVREILPFELTPGQKGAIREIVRDLEQAQPMMRLLQGDVGCGKTIVAAVSAVVALESGLQVAFMAPTELLAEQHYASLGALLGDRYRLGLITGSATDPEELRGALASGRLQMAVGTHALIQQTTRFDRLGLVIVDEQHRFGVAQRQELQRKGESPDLLVMTATPIPRSLALTAYGDLDLSLIEDLPPGRRPVETSVRPERDRSRVYDELKRDLDRGARAYVVVPLIDASERLELSSIEGLAVRLQERLAPYRCAELHGRSSAEERARILRDFASGEVQILLATTVIEVGVDVPEASVMIIESAQRFGLAQLHQLRGRVGRGRIASRCVALHGATTPEGKRRLEVFRRASDGFTIAEADLEIRGPGDLLGTRQAGLPPLLHARLPSDARWVARARRDAWELILGRDDEQDLPPGGGN